MTLLLFIGYRHVIKNAMPTCYYFFPKASNIMRASATIMQFLIEIKKTHNHSKKVK